METIQVPSFPSINLLQKTYLAADALKGQADATFFNISDTAVSDKWFLGNIGANSSEILQVESIDSDTGIVTFTTDLTQDHRKNEAATKIFGNMMILYRAANVDGSLPADSDFSQVGSPVAIDADQGYTTLTDPSGSSSYWYKCTFYNSVTAAETPLSMSVGLRGGGYGNYTSIENIKDEAGIPIENREYDNFIALYRVEAQSEVNGKLAAAGYTIPLQNTTGVEFVPDIVELITKLLAAGLALRKNYGIAKASSSKNGQEKIDEARRMLAEIQLNDTVLIDATGSVLAKESLVDGWPDNTTQSTKPGELAPSTGSVIAMSKIF